MHDFKWCSCTTIECELCRLFYVCSQKSWFCFAVSDVESLDFVFNKVKCEDTIATLTKFCSTTHVPPPSKTLTYLCSGTEIYFSLHTYNPLRKKDTVDRRFDIDFLFWKTHSAMKSSKKVTPKITTNH